MAYFAHVAFQKHHILPRDFYELDSWSQAFIIASTLVQADDEKEAERELKSKMKQ